MTKIIPDELPSSISAETTKGKGQPSPAGHLDDDGHKIFQHVMVTSFMFVCFIAFALLLWSEQTVIFTAITFLYSMVMSHLWLIKRRDQNKTQEPEDCELSASICTRAAPELMLVATGIMLISLGVAIFVFRPDWRDLAFVAFMVSSSTAVMLIYLKLEEIDRKSLEKFNNASHLV